MSQTPLLRHEFDAGGLFTAALLTHIALGALLLAAAAVALLARKGGGAHRRAGGLFAVAWVGCYVAALQLVAWRLLGDGPGIETPSRGFQLPTLVVFAWLGLCVCDFLGQAIDAVRPVDPTSVRARVLRGLPWVTIAAGIAVFAVLGVWAPGREGTPPAWGPVLLVVQILCPIYVALEILNLRYRLAHRDGAADRPTRLAQHHRNMLFSVNVAVMIGAGFAVGMTHPSTLTHAVFQYLLPHVLTALAWYHHARAGRAVVAGPHARTA